MSLVIPPGFGSAALIFNGAQGTQPYVTTIGVDLNAAEGDFVGAANSVMAAYAASIIGRTSNQLTLDRVTLSVGQDGPGGSVDSDLAPYPGTSTGTFPPTALSAIARKVTNRLGRGGRGRMFLPGAVTETEVDQDGALTPASRAALNPELEDFLDNLRLGNPGGPPTAQISMTPVLLHSNSDAPDEITSLIASDLVGWIRGRIR